MNRARAMRRQMVRTALKSTADDGAAFVMGKLRVELQESREANETLRRRAQERFRTLVAILTHAGGKLVVSKAAFESVRVGEGIQITPTADSVVIELTGQAIAETGEPS